jgi:chromosome segregation ATPase
VEAERKVSEEVEAKTKELSAVAEKNLGLSKRVELLEAERASCKVRLREGSGRVSELEKQLSDKVGYIKDLDKRLVEFREEVGKLKKQRDGAVKDRDDAVVKLVEAERKVSEDVKNIAKLKKELVEIREKLANTIRKESETAERNSKYTKRLKELELEIKTISKEKSNLINQSKRSKNKLEPPINKVKEFGNRRINKEKQKESFKVQRLNKTKFQYPPKETKEELFKEKTKSNDGCSFYFGYLCEREKGEAIPNSCIACSKSLDCMLSKVHQSIDSVQEIKKWYNFR